MRKLLALTLTSFLFLQIWAPHPAVSECINSVCVDVSADPANNQIIITAHKPGSTSIARPARTHRATTSPRPKKPWIPWAPRTPQPRSKPPKPKLPQSEKKISTAALVDRVTQLIPHGAIHYQPNEPLLVRVPINMWSDLPENFSFRSVILGVVVTVKLEPEFTWDFGDGVTQSGRGAPYPIGEVRHAFTSAGAHDIVLTTVWQGKAWLDGLPITIPGGLITQRTSTTVTLFPAKTQFRK